MHKVRMLGKPFPAMIVVVTALWALVYVDARAQDTAQAKAALRNEGYLTPTNKMIADAVLASRPEDKLTFNNISPDGKKFLVTKTDGMPSVDLMGRPCVHLAELAFDHTAYRSHQLYVR